MSFDVGAGMMPVAVKAPVRHGPPQPNGALTAFPYSARLLDDAIEIVIDNVRPGAASLSGQTISGRVRTKDSSQRGVEVFVRAFVESRTLFWSFERDVAAKGLRNETVNVKMSNKQRDEWHRAVYFKMHLDDAAHEYPFSFTLPHSIDAYTQYNEHETAPRDLNEIPRALPPTLRNNANGSIEHVIEAVILTDENGSLNLPPDERGMLIPIPGAHIARTVVPVLPADVAARDIYATRGFTTDPRCDGIVRHVQRSGDSGKELFSCKIPFSSGLGKSGSLVVTTHTPLPFYVARSAPSIISTLEFRYIAEKSGFMAKARKQPIEIARVAAVLTARTSTRGGPDTRPFVLAEEQFRKELMPTDFAVPIDGSAVTLDIEMLINAGHLTPSVKTPNVENEYILTITVQPRGQALHYVMRTGVQLLTGDSDAIVELDSEAAPAYAAM